MPNYLLTGAGFSRNWGSWLANEAFEYLLGCEEIDNLLRHKLWQSKTSGNGFEDTLADLQQAYNYNRDATVGRCRRRARTRSGVTDVRPRRSSGDGGNPK